MVKRSAPKTPGAGTLDAVFEILVMVIFWCIREGDRKFSLRASIPRVSSIWVADKPFPRSRCQGQTKIFGEFSRTSSGPSNIKIFHFWGEGKLSSCFYGIRFQFFFFVILLLLSFCFSFRRCFVLVRSTWRWPWIMVRSGIGIQQKLKDLWRKDGVCAEARMRGKPTLMSIMVRLTFAYPFFFHNTKNSVQTKYRKWKWIKIKTAGKKKPWSPMDFPCHATHKCGRKTGPKNVHIIDRRCQRTIDHIYLNCNKSWTHIMMPPNTGSMTAPQLPNANADNENYLRCFFFSTALSHTPVTIAEVTWKILRHKILIHQIMRRNEISEEICFYYIFLSLLGWGGFANRRNQIKGAHSSFGAAKDPEMRSVKDMFTWHLFGNLFPIGLSSVSWPQINTKYGKYERHSKRLMNEFICLYIRLLCYCPVATNF